MKRTSSHLFQNRTLQLALLITLGVMAGQHLITEHVLTAQHLGNLDHIIIFTMTGMWLLPAAVISVVLGRRLARLIGIGSERWWHWVELAGLISIVMLEVRLAGIILQLFANPLFDALLPLHHHTTDPFHDLLLGQMLTFGVALAGLFLQSLQDVEWRQVQLPSLSLHARKRVLSPVVIASMLLGLLPYQMQNGVLTPATTQAVSDACTDPGAPQRSYNVSAIYVRMTLNHFGDNDPDAAMYVLTENITALRAEELTRKVTTGLRNDLIQALVIRANLGECVTINFTNQLNQAAAFHAQGLAFTVDNAGGMVGNNPNTFAAANGGTRTYRISMPPANDPRGEGAYYFYSHGASRVLTSHGLFGALVAEPPGSTYLNAMTGTPLASGWEAIIVDPNDTTFREFTLVWHEIGDEDFKIRDRNGEDLPTLDDLVSGAYRPGSRGMNYRSEPFMDRLLLQEANGQQMDKALAYSSYAFGDPATPMPRSYLGEPTKTRLVQGGNEMFHVYHLHGGGTRWRRNPFADARDEYHHPGTKKGVTENAFSIRLDSQSAAPSETFTFEHECGAGGCQQTAGDYLFHCHIGPHYVAGMWSFWRVFDTLQPDLAVLPARTPAPVAVNSLGLIGKVVEGKTLLPQVQVSDPNTQVALEEWVSGLLPVQGAPFDELDASVWDWKIEYVNDDLNLPLVLGEPETTFTWANYTPNPGARPDRRPEIMFNPGNARYTWPILRPHLGRRPPFASNQHGGAPWAGETATATRPDGMCPDTAPNIRTYPVTAIQKRLEIAPGSFDEGGMLFVLNEDKQAVLDGTKLAEPLVLRSNVGDCVDVVLTSSLEDARAFHTYSKVNLHIHFVQFDPQASDGVISGMSFEQSVRPYTTELSAPGALVPVGRTLTQGAPAGANQIAVTNATRLHVGSAFGIGLDRANIEIRTITAIDAPNNLITLDEPLAQNHVAGEPVGVEFVRYRWYSDVDSGTVFYHSHITFTDWYHGLIGAQIIEPIGSTYHDPTTGQPIRSGTVADIHTLGMDGNTASGPWPGPPDGTTVRGFREFVVFFTADSPANGPSGGTINLRASPFDKRDKDPGRIFSSVTNGDPFTPLFRTYLGDPVMIRGMSVVEKEGALRITGHRFRPERFAPEGVQIDTAGLDVSERYDLILEGGAGGIQQKAGDYLYYTTITEQFVDGAWGLMRVFDRVRGDLQVLPGRAALPSGPGGFPQQQVALGGAPLPAANPGAVCPVNAPLRSYEAVIFQQPIPYYPGLGGTDLGGIVYALAEDETAIRAGTLPVRPLVVRTNVGECLEIGLTNKLAQSASLHAGELTHDPQGSFGAAIGFNYDSTVAPNARRVYRFYADQDVGVTLFYNLANPTTVARGAFGAIVVEPAGSIYRNPLDGTPVRSGIVADIITPYGGFREFVGLLNDEDDRIGQNVMPYPTVVAGFTGLNYVAERFANRLAVNPDPALVFSSSVHGDPANLLQAYLGDAVRLRIGKPWGTQGQVFAIAGHRWPLEPGMANSNLITSKSLRSGEAFDMLLHGGAGGQAGAPGDYFLGDKRAPFMEAGIWGLLRVLPNQAAGLLPLPAPGITLHVQPSLPSATIGDSVAYTYTVTNSGNETLNNVTANDSLFGAVPLDTDTLAPGATATGSRTLLVEESHLPGPLVGNITVTGTPAVPPSANVSANISTSVTLAATPAVVATIVAQPSNATIGQAVVYTFTVTNNGNTTLNNVVAGATQFGALWPAPVMLQPGQSVVQTRLLQVVEGLLPGPLVHTLVVTGTPPIGDLITASANTSVTVSGTPAAELAVTAPASARVGETVTLIYSVKNTGDVTLSALALDEDLVGPLALSSTTLAPGATVTAQTQIVVEEQHLPGPLTSQATLAASAPSAQGLNTVKVTNIDLQSDAALSVAVAAAVDASATGDAVQILYELHNSGDTTIHDITATDDRLGAIALAATTLPPGESTTGTAVYTIQAADLVDAFVHTVTASGVDSIGRAVQASHSHTLALSGGTIAVKFEGEGDGPLAVTLLFNGVSFDAGIGATRFFEALLTGQYAISYATLADWVPISATCDGDTWTSTAPDDLSVSLTRGQVVTCTFTLARADVGPEGAGTNTLYLPDVRLLHQ